MQQAKQSSNRNHAPARTDKNRFIYIIMQIFPKKIPVHSSRHNEKIYFCNQESIPLQWQILFKKYMQATELGINRNVAQLHSIC